MRRNLAAALGVAIMLAACSSGDEEQRSDDDARPTETSVSEDWDPSEWTATVQITPPPVSSDEREQFRADWLERGADGLDGVPEVELIRWTDGWADYGEATAACLNDAGFPAVHDGMGGMLFDPGVPEAQDAALALASYTCDAQFSIDPRYLQDWSEEQVGLVYDYWDEYFIPCMEAHGHPIDRASQPSRAAFVAAFPTEERCQGTLGCPCGRTRDFPAHGQFISLCAVS